ncbi:hypothetical protein P700755_001438 [Psychroflexus torquis ATCC 700755]|uniref:Uncharacterized protein n=1 Tax=Psychroflexus torquis (strain ATCC 700755 / CIP 106069 / ACAM 623) TaxID=313595 RepID=K4ICM3_PSYTT|nr:hypothetical protein P700755_001438 [Psychroflexus torquis ATCC 700755]
MKMVAINKHNSKLKNWSIEMPNAPYTIPLYAMQKNQRCEFEQRYFN